MGSHTLKVIQTSHSQKNDTLSFVCISDPGNSSLCNASPQIPGANAKVGCGPPRLLEVWPNQTVTEGDAVRMYCPLDTRNSCLVQLVEWYFSPEAADSPKYNGRKVMKDLAQKFDPLLGYIPQISLDQKGYYTCVLANNEGRVEISTYLNVREVEKPDPRPAYIIRAQEKAAAAKSAGGDGAAVYSSLTSAGGIRGHNSLNRANTDETLPLETSVTPSLSRPRTQVGYTQTRPPMRTTALPYARMTRPGSGSVMQAASSNTELDTVFQHLRYIMEKVKDFDIKIESMDSRIRALEV